MADTIIPSRYVDIPCLDGASAFDCHVPKYTGPENLFRINDNIVPADALKGMP